MADFADQLRGERLELRRWTPAHLDVLLDAVQSSHDELHLWMSWAASPATRASTLAVIENAQVEFDNNEKWNYGLFEDVGACVGSAGLRRSDEANELEIGYWVRTDRTRRGYATEAASVLTAAAFDSPLAITRVRISMDAANLASSAVPRRLGFHLEGKMNREIRTPGHTGEGVLWTVTREQWRTRSV